MAKMFHVDLLCILTLDVKFGNIVLRTLNFLRKQSKVLNIFSTFMLFYIHNVIICVTWLFR